MLEQPNCNHCWNYEDNINLCTPPPVDCRNSGGATQLAVSCLHLQTTNSTGEGASCTCFRFLAVQQQSTLSTCCLFGETELRTCISGSSGGTETPKTPATIDWMSARTSARGTAAAAAAAPALRCRCLVLPFIAAAPLERCRECIGFLCLAMLEATKPAIACMSKDSIFKD